MVQIQLVNGWQFAYICGQLTNCTLDNDTIQDPDIADIGVLLAFMLTAIITVLTVFMAYCTQSLPADRYSELDDAAISGVRKILLLTRRRIKRLSYNDQLITAISLLIAAYGRICVISAYSFQVVAASAWFSCTTHLSTLTVLQRYFDEHKVLRSNLDDAVLDLEGLAPYRIQPLTLDDSPLTSFGIVTSILTFTIWLSYGYGRTVMEIYSQQYRASTENWLSWIIIKIMLPAKAPWLRRKTSDKVLKALNRVLGAVYQSFLWEIVLLWLYLTYGLVLMLSTLITPGNQVIFEAIGIGFGQILPLALLGLPILTACEAYYEWMDGLKKPLVESSEHIKQDSTSTESIDEPTTSIPLDELPSPNSSDQQQANHSLAAATSDSSATSIEHLITPRGGTELDSGSTESHGTENSPQVRKHTNSTLVVISELAEQHTSDTASVQDTEHPQVPRVNTLGLEECRPTSPPTDVTATQQRQLVLKPAPLTRREKITATILFLGVFLQPSSLGNHE